MRGEYEIQPHFVNIDSSNNILEESIDIKEGGHLECFYENGLKKGKEICYDKSGNISKETHYKDGKKHGSEISYFENGDIFLEANYNLGKRIYDDE